MSLSKRGNVWRADLRADGGPRLSLKTTHEPTARLLHVELERMVLRGETVTNDTVKALKASAVSLQGATAAALGAPARPSTLPAGPRTVTLREAFELAKLERDKWSESRNLKTIEANYSHVAAYFGHARQLGTITSMDTAAYRARLKQDGKSASTINQRGSLLSCLFDTAIMMHNRTGDPRYAVVKPRIDRMKIAPPRFCIISPDEERTIVRHFRDIDNPRMAELVECLLDTGFRLGEMLRVDPSSPTYVDWDNNMLWARETKSGVDRCVPMTKRVRLMLSGKPHGWQGLTVSACDKAWSRMRKATGIKAGDPDFVIHALRHTCCTRLVLAGMDAFRIQAWMGHRSITTTQVYVTVYGPQLKQLQFALEKFATPQETPLESAVSNPETDLTR